MSKNIKLNDTNYTGVSTVQLTTTDGGTATFKDTDEITTPSGSVTITENGTHDVTNYASAVVNVASGSSGSSENSYEMGQFTITENTNRYTYEHSLGRVPKFALVYPIDVDKYEAGVTEHSTHSISTLMMLNGLGQEDYEISGNEAVLGNNPYTVWNGIGYDANAQGGGQFNHNQSYTVEIEFTEEHVIVGNPTEANIGGGGHFTVGTYGIIVG